MIFTICFAFVVLCSIIFLIRAVCFQDHDAETLRKAHERIKLDQKLRLNRRNRNYEKQCRKCANLPKCDKFTDDCTQFRAMNIPFAITCKEVACTNCDCCDRAGIEWDLPAKEDL